MAIEGILAVVGLAGTGKSTVVGLLHEFTKAPVIYFGGMVIGEVQRRGLPVTEANERMVREDIRARDGMSAVAKLAAPQIDDALAEGQGVIIDGLYSFAEYEYLVERYPGQLSTLAVHAPRLLREQRLGARPRRPLTPAEIRSRDLTEIANLDKARPITLADWHLVNDATVDDLIRLLGRLGYAAQAAA